MTAHVLVVDDDSDLRGLLVSCLGKAGYVVVGAANGREALTQIEFHRPALVLLDMQMPVMSGFEILMRLREANVLTPVVLVSGGIRAQTEGGTRRIDPDTSNSHYTDDVLELVARFVDRAPD